MKYTPRHFREANPEWKQKKDTFLGKIFYRPLSYIFASFAANRGISANTVSCCSIVIAVLSGTMFIINNHICNIVGAVLMNVWLLMDCIDGNLARGVKQQPFGDFVDGVSGYVLAGLMCSSMAFCVYNQGGIIVPCGSGWFLFTGALASEADTLMRLIYHKYKSNERDLADKGILETEKDVRKDIKEVGNFRVRVEMELGIGGILPVMSLIAVALHALDLVVIYCFIYYGTSCIAMSLLYITRAMR